MDLKERRITLPTPVEELGASLLDHLRAGIEFHLKPAEQPIRLAVAASDSHTLECELGVIDWGNAVSPSPATFLDFHPRRLSDESSFNGVLLIPTGIGAEIGGHAGDAGVVANLLAEVCDTLVLHPNVVNASDINEMPGNSFYVEGSLITRMMLGQIGLRRVRSNRLLVLLDNHPIRHFVDAAVNTVNASRATYGLDVAEVICLDPPISMKATYAESGRAAGQVTCLDHCLNVLSKHAGRYDAIALSTVIKVPFEYHLGYFESGGDMVNPWGGVEAMFTHALSTLLDKPAAHAPMFESREIENLETGIVDPRMAAEAVSTCFLQCVLKGLRQSPGIVSDREQFHYPDVFSAENVSCLVIPDGCLGLPTLAALEQGIPVIAVRGNTNLMRNDLLRLPWAKGQLTIVENYLEAVGAMAALKAGLAPETIRRPIHSVDVSIARAGDIEDRKRASGE